MKRYDAESEYVMYEGPNGEYVKFKAHNQKIQQLQQQNQEMLAMLKKVLFRVHFQQEDEWLEEEALALIAKIESDKGE